MPVVHHPYLVRRQQLPPRSLPVLGPCGMRASAPSAALNVDGLLSKQFGHVFVGGLLVASQIQEHVGVSHYGFPLLLKERSQLGEVLQYHRHRDLPGPHGGQHLLELIRQRHVGELVHYEVDVYRKPTSVYPVRRVVKLLEQLGIQHPDEEVVGAVVVRYDREYRRLPLSDLIQLHLIAPGHRRDGFQIELLQPGHQRYLNGFESLCRSRPVASVVFERDMVGILHLEPLEQHVQRRKIVVVVLPDVAGSHHLHDRLEVLLLRRCLVVQIEHHSQQQHLRRLFPERILT